MNAVNIDRTPFWIDEAIATLPAFAILETGVPSRPFDHDFMPFQIQDGMWDPATPVYRYALAAVAALTGRSEATARGFSLVVAALAAWVLGCLVAELWGARVGWSAALIFVCSPALLYLAREARHHTWVVLLGLLSIWTLLRAVRRPDPRATLWWLPLLVLTLLSHPMAYLVLPIGAAIVSIYGLRVLRNNYTRGTWVWHGLFVLLFLAVWLPYFKTLPFFNTVTCVNRPVGCRPDASYYLGVAQALLHGFAPPMLYRAVVRGVWWSLPGVLLVFGLIVATWRGLRRGRTNDVHARRSAAVAWLWLLLPALLLSIPEVKFPRYLWIWFWPAAAAFCALGVDAVGRRCLRGRGGEGLRVALLCVVCAWPAWGGASGENQRFRWQLPMYLQTRTFDASTDNWQQVGAQVAWLRSRLKPGDVIVASLDDASLSYYLPDWPVYGFLNSVRTDRFFLGLLVTARERGTRVFFVDQLPGFNFCLRPHAKYGAVSVDCREKYRRFYARCLAAEVPPDTVCVRRAFAGARH